MLGSNNFYNHSYNPHRAPVPFAAGHGQTTIGNRLLQVLSFYSYRGSLFSHSTSSIGSDLQYAIDQMRFPGSHIEYEEPRPLMSSTRSGACPELDARTLVCRRPGRLSAPLYDAYLDDDTDTGRVFRRGTPECPYSYATSPMITSPPLNDTLSDLVTTAMVRSPKLSCHSSTAMAVGHKWRAKRGSDSAELNVENLYDNGRIL